MQAQDLKSIDSLWKKQELARAKQSIDLFVENNSEDTEAWLLKASIYNDISKDARFKELVVDGKMEVFKSIERSIQLDPALVEERLKVNNYNIVFDIYKGYTSDGVTLFNAGTEKSNTQDYAAALALFKKAAIVGNLIFKQGWGLNPIDTLTIYYTAISALYADKQSDAFNYCKLIADKNITYVLATNSSTEPLYQWLVYYYKQKTNGEALDKYTQASIKNFPISTYFELNYIDWLKSNKDYLNMFTWYESLFKKDDLAKQVRLNYCNDLFSYLYNTYEPVSNREKYKFTLTKEITELLKKYPTEINTHFLLAKFYINQAADCQKDKSISQAAKKNKVSSLLKKSNLQLIEIVDKAPDAGNLIYKESLQLLVSNFKLLKMPGQIRRYMSMMK